MSYTKTNIIFYINYTLIKLKFKNKETYACVKGLLWPRLARKFGSTLFLQCVCILVLRVWPSVLWSLTFLKSDAGNDSILLILNKPGSFPDPIKFYGKFSCLIIHLFTFPHTHLIGLTLAAVSYGTYLLVSIMWSCSEAPLWLLFCRKSGFCPQVLSSLHAQTWILVWYSPLKRAPVFSWAQPPDES